MININDENGLLDKTERESIRDAAQLTLLHEGRTGHADIFVLSSEEIREVNEKYRGVDSSTDVLSFPMAERGAAPLDGFWGDILICHETAHRQMEKYGHSAKREFAFLTIHGMLHLLGYDHENGADEHVMIEKQKLLLGMLNLL